jgi:hypothetical protein
VSPVEDINSFHVSGTPEVGDGSPIPLLDGYDIEVIRSQIFQGRIRCVKNPIIDRLDIVMTVIAEIDTAGLFSLAVKIL